MENEFTAMIPARLGSKRIPQKNIRCLCGKPLIQYPVELALGAGCFSEVWVNTESRPLGGFAEKLGAKFHERPQNLAVDGATNREFVYEFLLRHDCRYLVMMNTTSPLLRPETLERFIAYVRANDFDTVLSVASEREETFFRGEPLNFSLSEKTNSQDLEPVEKIVWSLTTWKRRTFLKLQEEGVNPVFGGKIGKFVIPKDEACDLDTEEDWRIAEGILTARNLKDERIYAEL